MAKLIKKLFGRTNPEDHSEKSGGMKTNDSEDAAKSRPDDIDESNKTEPLSISEEQSQETIRLPKEVSDNAVDVDSTEPLIKESEQFDPHALYAAGDTSVGRQRDHNEDAFYMVTYFPKDGQEKFNFGLYIVADGMGGHQFGEVASQAAVNAVSEEVIGKIFDPMLAGDHIKDEERLHQLLQDAYQSAHLSIRKDAPGGGTTVTTLLILEDKMTIAHIGDSRAYHISPDGNVNVLTRDHSFVKKLIELGHITAEEAASHPQRNVLYRALGQGESSEAEINTSNLPMEGHILVCSDGLWGVVPESRIVEIVNTDSQLDQACKKLIDSANSAGGPDNITAILVRLPS